MVSVREKVVEGEVRRDNALSVMKMMDFSFDPVDGSEMYTGRPPISSIRPEVLPS